MRTRFGFTLIEALIVIAIVSILLAVGFIVAEPAREKARQATCVANMKQLYSAMLQYGSDNDYQPIAGLNGLTFFPHDPYSLLRQYGLSKEQLYCPNTPPKARREFGTTYICPLWAEPWSLSSGEKSAFARFAAQLSEDPGKTPLLKCTLHDETFYWPRESQIDVSFAKPYLIILYFDGHIHVGRSNLPRAKIFTR